MRYLLMICADETAVGAQSPEEGSAMLAEYMKFGEEMGRRGVLAGGAGGWDGTGAAFGAECEPPVKAKAAASVARSRTIRASLVRDGRIGISFRSG